MTRFARTVLPILGLLAAIPLSVSAAPARAPRGIAPAPSGQVRIVAIVNGAVITNRDIDNRTRLFAVTSGLSSQPEVLARLRPQILRQLVDEKLRMQDVEAKHIVVTDKQIAEAIREIETRNGMPAGALRARLSGDGVSFATLVDQIRTEIGWTMLLREQLGDRLKVTDADITQRMQSLKQQIGRPEYHVAEIFIPVENPTQDAEARGFADTVIKQLRAGAPFPVIAAQFSQSQSALQGGDLGWVQPNQLDPSVAKLVQAMPPGAISEPVPVPGGFAIVHLVANRQIGNDIATIMSMRQAFLPFSSPLNPQAPTAQQMATLKKAEAISASVHSCPEMEQAAKENASPRPADPGPVRLDSVNPPQFRAMLASQPLDRATKPLVSREGIAVMIVCSRGEQNLAQMDRKDVTEQILQNRVELLSRQMQQDLRRKASIDIRGEPAQQSVAASRT